VINTDNAYRKKMHHDSGGDSHCVVSKKTKKNPAVARENALQPIQFLLQYTDLQGCPR